MQTNATKLSLVIPFYNELNRMEHHVATLNFILPNKEDWEIVYVDDGSFDGGQKVLQYKLESLIQSLTSKNVSFKFIRQDPNQGKGAAIKRGVEEAQGEYILFTDFDFAISLNEIEKFMTEAKNHPHCAVIASRKEEGEHIKNATLLRRILGSGFNLAMRLIVSLPIKDTQCGFKLFTKELAKKVFPQVKISGFAFDVEVLKRIIDQGYPVIEKGITLSHDDRDSTINIFIDPFKMLWDLVKLRWRLKFEKN